MNKVEPTAWEAYRQGKAFQKLGKFTEAIACYLQAIAAKPDFSPVYATLRHIPLGCRDPAIDQLIACYHTVLASHPDFASPYINLAGIYTDRREVDAARAMFQLAAQRKAIAAHPELANALWKTDASRYPDFALIGAPRCGTTSLYRYLVVHPAVLPAAEKEIRYFSQDYKRGLDWYLSHFAPPAIVPPMTEPIAYMTGEATPTYLNHPQAAYRMQEIMPHLKLIVLLRNPVARAFSHYQMLVRRGTERRSFAEVMRAELQELSQATTAELLQATYWKSCTCLSKSLYYFDLQRWLSLFPRESFLILRSEDFYRDPAIAMQQVFAFLQISDHVLPRYPRYNAQAYAPMPETLKSELHQFFAPYNRQLEALLERKMNWDE